MTLLEFHVARSAKHDASRQRSNPETGHHHCNRSETIIMTRRAFGYAAIGGVLFLGACAQNPMGPTVQVLPGPGKSFSAFQKRSGGLPTIRGSGGKRSGAGRQLARARHRGNHDGARCGIGGGDRRRPGCGSWRCRRCTRWRRVGTVRSSNAQNSIQALYDNAFVQCMYSLGNSVPNSGPMMVQPQAPGQPTTR